MSRYAFENPDNCYICNVLLGPCRNHLGTLTNFTQTPIAEILEAFFEAKVLDSQLDLFSICQECFITVEKYDELQFQSEQIQNKLTQLYSKSRTVEVVDLIEEEPPACDVRLKCQKCHENFRNIREMADHSHCSISRRRYTTRTSSQFQDLTDSEDISYEYESPSRFQRSRRSQKVDDDPNNQISEKFLKEAQENGVEYDLEAFQRAFGFNEAEATAKNAVKNSGRRVASRLRQVEPVKAPAPQKKTPISSNFAKTMEQSGITYDLASFQKAFGYADSVEKLVKEDPEVTKECKELKTKGFIKCPECDLKFTSRNNFLSHMKVHKPKDKSLFCSECKRYFKTAPCLQLHLATDHGRNNGPVDCPICLKTYQDKSALRSHYYIHKMQRDFLCVRCGATFVHKKSFDMHNLMHDDIRPFACTVQGCTKKFRNSGKLKIHLRVHTGEKIYECPHCPGKRFAQKWGMDLHIKKQHKNEIIPNEICKICGISIQTKAKMRIHLANVHQVASDSSMEVSGQQQAYYDESE